MRKFLGIIPCWRRGFIGIWPGIYQPNIAVLAINEWWKSGGATGCIGAWQAKGAASQAASYINLANPGTYNLTTATAPTWATGTGWTFAAASSQYLLTGYVAPSTQARSLFVRISGHTVAGTHYAAGSQIDGNLNDFGIAPGWNDGKFYFGNGQIVGFTGNNVSAVLGVAGNTMWKDGSKQSGTMSSPTGYASNGVAIGCTYRNAGRANFYTGNVVAAAIYSVTVTDAQALAISTAMAAL